MVLLSLLAALPLTFLTAGQPVSYQIPQSHLHGIYFTSNTVANKTGEALMQNFSKVGGNLIVFDVQDATGHLAYPSTLPVSMEINNRGTKIPDLAAAVDSLHKRGFYVAARFVLFNNPFLAHKKPEWVLKRKASNSLFIGKEGPIWLDPGNQELQNYLIGIAGEIALAGADEVQFDYVRFPDSGTTQHIPYSFTGDKTSSRDQTMTLFVSQAASIIHFLGANVSIDVFGINVWDNVSWKVIGQNIPELAKYVDVICPMPYPSHFGPGWGGHKNPADEPYFFVQETTKKFVSQTAGTGVTIRPWLQAFTLRVSKYNAEYIREQVRALTDIGIDEFTLWNARNVYDIPFQGLQK